MKIRYASLDGLRGFGMLTVFSVHCFFLNTRTPIDKFYSQFIQSGWISMHFFFALSGFLIMGILLDSKGGKGYYKNFYARRFLKIFPLYYLLLFVVLILFPKVFNIKDAQFGSVKGDEWSYWVYMCNYTIARAGGWQNMFLNVAWSLSVEEQFYIFCPLLVAYLSVKQLFRLSLGLIVAAVFIRWGLVLSGANDMTFYVSTASRFDAIVAGGVVALLYRYHSSWTEAILSHRRQLLLITTFFTVFLLLVVGGDPDRRPVQIYGHGLIAVFSAVLVLNLTCENPIGFLTKFFEIRFFQMVGKYSYAIYLIHLPVREFTRYFLYGPKQFIMIYGSQLPGQLLFLFIAGSISLGLAAFLYHSVESFFLSQKRHFEYQSKSDIKAHEPLREAA